MSKPKPKFCVGEEVAVVSIAAPHLNINNAEIIKSKYGQFKKVPSGQLGMSWGYQLSHSGDSWLGETILRKLPPKERASWEGCVWQPKEVKE